ncbi:MAG: T9SS type A sorting domain-containing protein [Bacteroidetes bacterium]|nr:T9SS type A sorting domain-containing protein [Bacteroidota bacterium]
MARISLSLVIISILATTLRAQTITSKSTGGNWEDASTWVGNTVPTATNDVVIAGTVSVTSSASTCRNLTVNSGSFLQNGGGLGWVTFVVRGNIVNNGTIRNNPVNYVLVLDLRGDVTNNGVWQPSNTYFATKQDQHISQSAGKRFEGNFGLRDGNGYTDTNGHAIAASDLTFTGEFDLKWLIFDFASHALTMEKEGHLSWGTIANASDIYFRDSAFFYNTIVTGNTAQLHGVVRIDGAVSFYANIVNSDTMQHRGGLGWVTPVFYGDFTNNGLIRNNPVTGYAIALDLRGDVHNNGIWRAGSTYFAAKKLQHVSQTQGKVFENAIAIRDGSGYVDTNGSLIATSDLTFSGEFDMHWSWLDMDSNTLTLINHGHLGWGTIKHVPHIYCHDSSYFYNTIVGSDVVLHGSANIDGAVTFLGDVTVADTMRHWGGLGWVTPEIHGNFINNGLVTNNPFNNWGIVIRGFKDIINNGTWKAGQATLDGEGRRTVSLHGATGTAISVQGKKVILVGDNYLPTLAMSSGAICYVASEATLVVEDGTTNYGWNGVGNLGRITIPHKTVANTTRYDFYSGITHFNNGTQPDSVIVESYGRQTPKTFGNAVESWFRLRTVPATAVQLQYLDIYYGQADLNGTAEKDLSLYRSTDNGATWTMIDRANLLYHDSSGNYMRWKDMVCSGDYVLASAGMTPIPARSNVRVSIVGSSDLRVGAPNRMVVNLYNNSDAISGDIFLTLEANQKTRFLKTEDQMDNTLRTYALDDFATDSTDQQITFLVSSMGPREERDFTLYLTTPTASSIKGGAKPQVFWFIAAAAVYVAGAYISDYLTDKAVEGCFDLWMPPGSNANDKTLAANDVKAAIKEQAKRAALSTGKQLAEDGAKKILANKGLEHLVWPAKLSVNLLSCLENTIKGMQCYLGQKPIKDVFTHVDCNGSQKEVRPVVSKDPNHKSGPAGFGTEGFISSTGRMEYMIEFENAPDAQAAAYKIVVVDTLADVFDPATVVFGRMSHAFTATQSGNILRWEITGIDLPANKVPPEGEGWLTYSVLPKAGLTTGTTLGNRANIYFDANAPIMTNSYINTLDFAAPSTMMSALPSKTSDTIVTVRWNSIDPVGGSGYESAMLYMAKDDGAYVAVGNQDADSAQIIVSLDHTYSFFALAKDHVGNLEMTQPTPVSIRVTSGVLPSNLEADFWIREPYPNPTATYINLDYSLSLTGHTSVVVFDALGREVASEPSAFRSEGVYHTQIDCSGFTAGTYYVRLEQGGHIRTKKFVVH